MSVYVDDVRHSFGRMVMCHMWADTLDELLAAADAVGVQRKWIQGHPTLSFGKHRSASWVHFDVSLGAKAKALANGAILTDKYGPSEFTATANLTSPHEIVRERASKMLASIASCRSMFAVKGDGK